MRIGWGGDVWLDVKGEKVEGSCDKKEGLRRTLGRWRGICGKREKKFAVEEKDPLLYGMKSGTQC